MYNRILKRPMFNERRKWDTLLKELVLHQGWIHQDQDTMVVEQLEEELFKEIQWAIEQVLNQPWFSKDPYKELETLTTQEQEIFST